ncbi:hypothetical protein DV738_g3232, partial [Chaetothyriales sp. CBS 135597]
MATPSICRASARASLPPLHSAFAAPLPLRSFSTSPALEAAKINKAKAQQEKLKKRRKRNPFFKTYNLNEMEQFSLCDAVRYLRAFEVGKSPTSSKYEVHVKFRTRKNGPVIRQNQMQLPYPVKTDLKFCYICPDDSKAASDAREAGASYVGEEEVIQQIKAGSISFDRCFAHPASMQRLAKEGLPRILGPKGLMPNPKNGTITEHPKALFRELIGGALYKEKFGVVRMAIGQLAFSPEMLRDNLKAALDRLKSDAASLPDEAIKTVDEVVLSSTNGPGFSLNGTFKSPTSLPTAQLAG